MKHQILSLCRMGALGFGAVALSHQAVAATVTLMGDNIWYEYDDVAMANSGALALFGTPTIDAANDLVRFIPPSFRAESNDGGSQTTDANFIFDRVYSVSGAVLAQLNVLEFGDYEIINGGDAQLDLLLTVSNNSNFFESTGVFIPCPSCEAALDFTGDSGGKQLWNVGASMSPSLLFATNPNDIAVSIQNTLVATTNASGETAWIQKKINFVASTEVPLPASAWLFMSALGLLRAARLKR